MGSEWVNVSDPWVIDILRRQNCLHNTRKHLNKLDQEDDMYTPFHEIWYNIYIDDVENQS